MSHLWQLLFLGVSNECKGAMAWHPFTSPSSLPPPQVDKAAAYWLWAGRVCSISATKHIHAGSESLFLYVPSLPAAAQNQQILFTWLNYTLIYNYDVTFKSTGKIIMCIIQQITCFYQFLIIISIRSNYEIDFTIYTCLLSPYIKFS